MYVVSVSIQVLPPAIAAFIAASRVNAETTRLEPGNLRFDVLVSEEDPTVFMFYEVYRTKEDFLHHQTTAHYATWKALVAPMMARPRQGQRLRTLVPPDELWR